MENNENKKSFKELADEALDKVAGGDDLDLDAVIAFAAQFPLNNCYCCKYFTTPQCLYYPTGPVGAMDAGLAPSATCPGLAAK